MDASLIIKGAKGKGGSSAGPVEAKDSLRSAQYAEILDLISEGPIAGLVTGDLKSVYLDGVVVENQDGSRNFKIDSFAFVPGTQGQQAIQGFDTAQSEVAVGVKVSSGTPITRSVPVGAAQAIRVTVAVPELTQQSTTTGDLSGASVEYAVDLQSGGGGWVTRWTRVISGKTTTRYQTTVMIDLTGAGPWDVRVRRVSPDSTTVTLRNDLYWDSMTLVNRSKLRYPNSAIAGLRVAAEQFSRIPSRAYLMRGRIIQVPSNYNPTTRSYAGVWNGVFKFAYSDNPAWCYHDMISLPRYGLGRRIPQAKIDKWTLYRIGRYCDAVDASGAFVGVPDGRGGREARFTCNLYLQADGDAYQVLQDMAAIFRGALAYSGGALFATQDAPDTAYSLFTPANVVDGAFSYEGSARGVKKSACAVWWNNPENQYKKELEVFQDPDLVARYGLETVEISPLGITSRGMAVRIAKWMLYSEASEGELVKFATGSVGACVPLGRVFRIADPSVSGEQLGGLVASATATSVRLDRAVMIRSGETWTLHVMVPDVAQPTGVLTISAAVTNGPGQWQTLTLATALPQVPPEHAPWVLESSAVAPTTWRCIGVVEKSGDEGTIYEIQGLAHNPGKYDLIEMGVKLDDPPVSRMRVDAPVAIGPLVLRETIYRVAGVAYSRVTIGWTPPAPGLSYRVRWRLASGPWTALPMTNGQTADVDNVAPGLLEASVQTVNPIGVESASTLDGSIIVTGDPATPWGDPSGNLAPNTEFASGSFAGWLIGGWVSGKPLLFGGLERTRDPATPWIPDGVDAIVIGQAAPNVASDQLVWGGPAGTTDTSIFGVAYTDELIPIEPLKRYIVSGWCAGHGCRVGLYLEFKRVDGTPASAGGGAAWTPGPLGAGPALGDGWQRLRVASDAPADAAYIRLLVAKGNGSVGSSHAWMLRPQIQAGTTTQTEPGDYVPGVPRDVRQLGYDGDLDATRGSPAGTLVAGRPAAEVGLATQNFNARNDRLATPVQAPFVPIDGSSVDHVLNADGSADVSFEWLWTGDESSIDGFEVLVYQGATSADYAFGTIPTAEVQHLLSAQRRALILQGVAADRWYTFGVRAYRIVDNDVSPTGRMASALVKPTAAGEVPYLPTSQVAFAGNISGTVNGIPASQVNVWASVAGRPGNLAGLGGNEPILNNQIYVDGAGALQGVGAGAGTQVSNAVLPSSANLLFNSDWALGLRGWSVLTAMPGSVHSVDGAGDVWRPGGGVGKSTNTLTIYQAGIISGSRTAYMDVVGDLVPVEAGRRYVISAYTGAHRAWAAVFAWLVNASGTSVAHTYSDAATVENKAQASGGVDMAAWKRCYSVVTIPQGITHIKACLRKYDTEPGGPDSWAMFARAAVEEVGASGAQPGSWSPGPSGYTGELDATRGATFGVNVGGQMDEASAPTYVAPTTFTEGAGLTLAAPLPAGASSPAIAVSSPNGTVIAQMVGVLRIGDEPSSSSPPTVAAVRLVVNGAVVNTLPPFTGRSGQTGTMDVPVSLAWHGAVGGDVLVQAQAVKLSGSQAVSLLTGSTVMATALKR